MSGGHAKVVGQRKVRAGAQGMRLRHGGVSGSMLASEGMGGSRKAVEKEGYFQWPFAFRAGWQQGKNTHPGILLEHSAPPGRGEGACVGEWRQTATIGAFNLLKFLKGLPLAATPKS